MPSFVKVASLEQLSPGSSLQLFLDGKEIALFNIEGTIYAVDDRCSHAEAPLSDGVVEGCEVECPLHGARFDLRSGENLTPPALEPISTYGVKIEGNEIYIDTDFKQ